MNILIGTNGTASRLWRIFPQAEHLKKLGHKVQIVETDEFVQAIDADVDLIIAEMILDNIVDRLAKEFDIKVIMEIDDLIEWVPKDHYAKDMVNLRWRLMAWKAIRKADGLIVSNMRLKRRYDRLRIGKTKSAFLPNYLDLDYWDKPTQPNISDKIRILYSGGMSHVDDLKYINTELKEILEKNINTKFIHISAGGFSGKNPFTSYRFGEDLFKELPEAQREYMTGVSMGTYSAKLASSSADIGIAPVVENKFTAMKTPIKALEYGINGMAGVYSKFLYKDVVIHGKTGFLAETPKQFKQYLELLIRDQNLRKEMGKNAYVHVRKNYDIKDYVHRWSEYIDKICSPNENSKTSDNSSRKKASAT